MKKYDDQIKMGRHVHHLEFILRTKNNLYLGRDENFVKAAFQFAESLRLVDWINDSANEWNDAGESIGEFTFEEFCSQMQALLFINVLSEMSEICQSSSEEIGFFSEQVIAEVLKKKGLSELSCASLSLDTKKRAKSRR